MLKTTVLIIYNSEDKASRLFVQKFLETIEIRNCLKRENKVAINQNNYNYSLFVFL